jgi:hypothetical protein
MMGQLIPVGAVTASLAPVTVSLAQAQAAAKQKQMLMMVAVGLLVVYLLGRR